MSTDFFAAAAGRDHTLCLSDGRTLGYADYGDPAGTPWLAHHGGGDCRLLFAIMSDAAARNGIRLVSLDRWGIGLSDPRPNCTFLDWPDDVRELAEALGLDKFVVFGGGAGTATVLSCAYQLPARVTAAVLTEPVSPGMTTFFPPGRQLTPWRLGRALVRRFQARHRSLQMAPDEDWNERIRTSQGETTAFYEQAGMRAFWQHMQGQAFLRGPHSVLHEFLQLTLRPWGFDLSDVKTPVFFWQPENAAAEAAAVGVLAGQLPSCQATFIPDAERLWAFIHADEFFAAAKKTIG
jgi:pimeloyl-ACP methyl ester carboxylesterase